MSSGQENWVPTFEFLVNVVIAKLHLYFGTITQLIGKFFLIIASTISSCILNSWGKGIAQPISKMRTEKRE